MMLPPAVYSPRLYHLYLQKDNVGGGNYIWYHSAIAQRLINLRQRSASSSAVLSVEGKEKEEAGKDCRSCGKTVKDFGKSYDDTASMVPVCDYRSFTRSWSYLFVDGESRSTIVLRDK
jgi:hypothetical protein